jgi:hypothetical protein
MKNPLEEPEEIATNSQTSFLVKTFSMLTLCPILTRIVFILEVTGSSSLEMNWCKIRNSFFFLK